MRCCLKNISFSIKSGEKITLVGQNSSGKSTLVKLMLRLSTTRMVDRIYMFDSGVLIESGTHDSLMADDGKYAEMFRVQAQKYTDNLTA